MNIRDFEHLRSIPEIKFKDEVVGSETLTIASYMIATQELWDIPLAIECRGITFNSDGDIVCRPFEKFFNLNENPTTQMNLVKGWKSPYIFDKKDGSMVSPVCVGDDIFWKTKKSFYSDVALSCQRYAEELNLVSDNKFNETIKRFSNMGLTLIFEFTSPDNKIVIDYGATPKLTLIAVRDNVSGEYKDVALTAVQLGVNSAYEYHNKSLDVIIDEVPTERGIEGYVLFNRETQQRVKIKMQWYLDLHRVNTELRERDVVEMILNETIDDVKSTIVNNGLSLDLILEIEHNVRVKFERLIIESHNLAEVGKGMSRKEFAISHHNNPLFGLAIKEVDNIEPDYKKFFNKHYLKTYTLRCVYNDNFSQDAQ